MPIENFYGECGIDQEVREKFFSDYDYKGVMIELGAAHPVDLSISKHFRDNGWRCIGIEPNPDYCKMHTELGNEIYNYACSNENNKTAKFYVNEGAPMSSSALKERYTDGWCRKEIEVEVIKLNDLLEKINVNHIDLICVDVEGWELEVLEGFDTTKYKPKVIVVENYQNNHKYNEYMTSIGYTFYKRVSHNEIYTKEWS